MTPLALREHVAEPANLWIRHGFSRWPWPGGEDLWCDLATGGLGPSAAGGQRPSAVRPSFVDAEAVDLVRSATDVVYVPPLPADRESLRAAIVEAASASGAPLLIQTVADGLPVAPDSGRYLRELPGAASVQPTFGSTDSGPSPGPTDSGPSPGSTEAEPSPGSTDAGPPPNVVVAIDLLDSLVRHAATLREEFKENRQPSLPLEPPLLRDATLVWPLVTGWTDQPGILESAMARLAAAGARRVVPRAMALDARDRRLLAGHLQTTWPEAFDALFHGDESPPDVPAFRGAAEAAGLEHRLPRPLPAPPLPARLRLARELAGHLIELGDAATTGGDACYRAARFLDRDEVDIEAAAREGNLGILPWLEDPAKRAAERWLASRRRD